jgi:DNA primase
MDTSHIDLLALIGSDTPLKPEGPTNGGEFAGPCPFCGTGNDRFNVWPTPLHGNPRYWCRQCGRKGDAIQYLMDRDGRSYTSACALLGLSGSLPSSYLPRLARSIPLPSSPGERCDWDALNDPEWQHSARLFVDRCANIMNSPPGIPGREYCHRRGFTDEIIAIYCLGYNPSGHYETWGKRRVNLPKGIVIPWFGLRQELWAVNIRRLDGAEAKYKMAGGSANGLFGVSEIHYGTPVVMVEGEFCAMSLRVSEVSGITPVATGSATGARLTRWVGCLALASTLILAFDNDTAGEKAAKSWQEKFPQAVWLKPTRHDVNDMLMAGDDIAAWLADALSGSG